MDNDQVLTYTAHFVKKELEGEGSGHDWWHIHRVTQVTKQIARQESADLFICTMAALLHDIADEKLNVDEETGIQKVRTWLDSIDVQEDMHSKIMAIITSISYKGGHGPALSSIEAKVVQDADRLDAIGAIGIARCFAYGGSKGRIIYDPHDLPRERMSKEEYRKNQGTAISHFYEKLLKLKELMNTSTGRRLAEERHAFMEQYLQQFYAEWDGEK